MNEKYIFFKTILKNYFEIILRKNLVEENRSQELGLKKIDKTKKIFPGRNKPK